MLFHSTEIPELVHLCDRVLVLYAGRIVAEIPGANSPRAPSCARRSAMTLDDVVAETRQVYSGPLVVGEDLMAFEIGDTITVITVKKL